MATTKYANETTLPRDRFSGFDDNLSAFASDLNWAPGFSPLRIQIVAANGTFGYGRISCNGDKAIYQEMSGTRQITVFND